MNKTGSPYSITTDVVIMKPKQEQGLPLTFSEWKKLKKMIDRIDKDSVFFQSLGWFLLGIASTSFFSGINLCGDKMIYCFSLAVICLVTGIVTLIYARKERKINSNTKQDVLEEMNFIETRYE
jgi:hypothetical protein